MTTTPRGSPAAAPPRRPLKTRSRKWAQVLARALTRAGFSPNSISITSFVFAVAAGTCLLLTSKASPWRNSLFVAAAGCIQLRLLCNMLDGMVAIEGGRRTPYGEIFNDMPDRFADAVILVGAGYGISNFPWGHELGWLAAVMAIMTAYVRLLGGSMGVTQYFIGPMAKPHRMAVLTGACLLSILEAYTGSRGQILAAALGIIVVGSFLTCLRRTAKIVAELRSR